jgi:hypothetical protein
MCRVQSVLGNGTITYAVGIFSSSVKYLIVYQPLIPPNRYDQYTEEGAWDGLGPGIALRLISAYLEYLHLHFQIQRMLHRLTQQALPALLEVSLKLLSTSLVPTKARQGVYEIRRHFPSVILFYCFPAAGVLALELRRCTIERIALPEQVPRSNIIRNLSMLTSCLEWILLPGDGNIKLCSELNKMLAMVLDEVLNYQPPCTTDKQQENTDLLTSTGDAFFNFPMIEGLEPIPKESEDFLSWLEDANLYSNIDLF